MTVLSGLKLAPVWLSAVLLGSAQAGPANFSFAGSFSADDSVQIFGFSADGTSKVRLISYGYGGGKQANGQVVAAGGFDPILALFDSSGTLIGQNDDSISATPGACGDGVVNPDPNTHAHWDVCLDQTLTAGDYSVAVMQYDNFALGPNLADGFTYIGQPNFTAALTAPLPYGSCSNGQFCDVSLTPYNNRTNQWAFDILNVETANLLPEPASIALASLALLGLAVSSARRKS